MSAYSAEPTLACRLLLSTNSCAAPPECRSTTQSTGGSSVDATKRAIAALGPSCRMSGAEEAVEVGAVGRTGARAGEAGREIVQGQGDEQAGDAARLGAADQIGDRDLPLELVAMRSAGHEHGRPGAVPDDHQREEERPGPGRLDRQGKRDPIGAPARRSRGRSDPASRSMRAACSLRHVSCSAVR